MVDLVDQFQQTNAKMIWFETLGAINTILISILIC